MNQWRIVAEATAFIFSAWLILVVAPMLYFFGRG